MMAQSVEALDTGGCEFEPSQSHCSAVFEGTTIRPSYMWTEHTCCP